MGAGELNQLFRTQVQGAVAQVVLARPDHDNRLTRNMLLDLAQAVRGWAGDAAIGALILRAAAADRRPLFCAGLDLDQLADSGAAAELFSAQFDLIEALHHWDRPKVAIIHDKTPYGQGLAEETKKALNKRGTKEAMLESYTPGEKDYSALVSKLKAEAIDVIYVGGYHTEAALIIRQSHEKGYKPLLVSGDALVTDDYWKFSGPAGEGTLMTFPPDPRKDPKNKDLVAKSKAINSDPEGYTLYTYAAMQTYALAVTKAGGTDLQKVIGVLRAEKFDTVLGSLGFDAKGDVNAPGYVWYEWKAGKYDYAKIM
ncbi:MAG: hypothetical protein EXQ96_09585 [Alphaproteobacteria bacterium]|nr:hypothetical protein [Alphaproteobacteria bacterium]